ncbi:hypothetical protein ACWDE9_07940 [Streptomyces olivaceoviridis]
MPRPAGRRDAAAAACRGQARGAARAGGAGHVRAPGAHHARPAAVPLTSLGPVQDEPGLRHATAFAVSQHACASGLLAVDLAGPLLAADPAPDALALVLTGEKAGTGHNQSLPDVTVMGEGTAALLVSADRTGRKTSTTASRPTSHPTWPNGSPATGTWSPAPFTTC